MLRALLACLCVMLALPALAQDGAAGRAAALIKAYPDFLERIDGNELVWRDGTRMAIDDGKGPKSLDQMLDRPDIKDMFVMRYPPGRQGSPPAVDTDPGRVRYMPLFFKMYGDCRKSDVTPNASTVVWLKKKSGKTIRFTRINGAAAALQRVSDELDALPTASPSIWCRPRVPTIAAPSPAPTASAATASASPSTSRPSTPITGAGPRPTPTAATSTRTDIPLEIVRSSRSTASSGAATGTTTTPCTSSTARS